MGAWLIRLFWFRVLTAGVSLLLVVAVTAPNRVADAPFWDFLRGATGQPLAGDRADEGRALANAMSSRRAALAGGEMYAVIKKAGGRTSGTGAALLRRELPPLAATAEHELRSAAARVASTRVTTPAGTACRSSAVEFMGRRRWLFATVGTDVEGAVDPWVAVNRFAAGATALERWWDRQVRQCTSTAEPERRAELVRALSAF